MKILIIGDGGHARMVASILVAMENMEPLGYVSGDGTAGVLGPLSLPVLGGDDCVSTVDHDGVIVAVGDNHVRQRLFDQLSASGEILVNAVHPSIIMDPDVELGTGCVICPGVILNTGAVIGHNVILNTGCVVEHECSIGSHIHVAPGVKLAGNVTVNNGAFVGLGACIIQGITIGSDSVVGAGAVVIDDVASNSTVVGIPAKTKKDV
ncbi:transferase [Pseudodesulfovibrio nedwellii]|uniref:Transferase n=1 Tax=Pseudodesulfovibrio nedwellii TaxID=2973072 RepID=A0ABM8B3A5_9BACT|nr:acetyltransferase [Pseudodesulfovibrio nedwellii]BDQ38291.1 transferase [Pseudodesulfovibrio nedwellii]